MKIFAVILFILFNLHLSAQNYTVSGYITDKSTGETIIGSSINEKKLQKNTISNNFGYYSLTLPKGQIDLEYFSLGFNVYKLSLNLTKDTLINIAFDEGIELQEVVVSANNSETGVKGSQMSTIDIPIAQIRAMPAMMGEVDIIKALQMLPGVQSGTEGSSGMYVRGGGPDENLMLLDGVPVYNANHLMGFFSVFNADAIKNVTLYKGSFPARYGSRLSSVIDITTNNGNDKKVKGNVSLGLLSSKLSLEGPIIKEKTTFSISGRRTYADLMIKPFINMYNKNNNKTEAESPDFGYYFYDLNAKVTHKFNDKHRLFLSFYNGNDVIQSGYDFNDAENKNVKMNTDWSWGNTIAAIRWNYRVSPKLFCNTTLNYTRYISKIDISSEDENGDVGLGYNSGIEDFTAKTSFDYIPNSSNEIKFGGEYTYHIFKPDVTSFEASLTGFDTTFTVGNKSVITPHELKIFVEDNISFSKRFKGNIGAHYSIFSVNGVSYQSIQPRVSARYLLSSKLSLKASYCEMTQYVHLLASNAISLPTDLWVPATKNIKPMKAKQVSLGAFYELPYNLELSVEGYYKIMDNLIEYKEGESMFSTDGSLSEGWEDKVEMGKGWAYGLEILAQKSVGNTTGWVGYTLAWADRQFDNISFGKKFPAKYDRRHDINITFSHKVSNRFDFGANWVFGTGTTATLGTQVFNGPNYLGNLNANTQYTYYESRNNYRLPSSHRLDISVNFHKKIKWGFQTWNVSIFNVYNHHNPFVIFTDFNEKTNSNELKQISIMPILPSVTYSLKF